MPTSLKDAAPWFFQARQWRGVLGGPPTRIAGAVGTTPILSPLTATPAALSQALKVAARGAPGWASLSVEEREALDDLAREVGVILSGATDRVRHWERVACLARGIAARGR